MTGLGIMAALTIFGVLSPKEAVQGFANPAVITVGAMFLVSMGLIRTGAVGFVAEHVIRLSGGNAKLALAISLVVVGAASAFINNTAAVVVLFIPIVLGLDASTDQPLQVSDPRVLRLHPGRDLHPDRHLHQHHCERSLARLRVGRLRPCSSSAPLGFLVFWATASPLPADGPAGCCRASRQPRLVSWMTWEPAYLAELPGERAAPSEKIEAALRREAPDWRSLQVAAEAGMLSSPTRSTILMRRGTCCW